MAVLDMVERVREAWRNKNVALRVFIDLKKAFNIVDHRILLAKLEHYGVRGEALGLLESYLRDRFQYVVYDGGIREAGGGVWGPAGLSVGAPVLPSLCQQHGEGYWGAWFCPACR
jgi:hypothetical protein